MLDYSYAEVEILMYNQKEKLGEAAAEILMQMLKDGDYLKNPVQKVIVPELVIKDSCIKR